MKLFKNQITKKMVFTLKHIKDKLRLLFYFIKKITSKFKMRLFSFLNSKLFKTKLFSFLNSKQLKTKYFIFLSLAFLTSVFVFYFMSLLISTGKNPSKADNQNIQINFLLNSQIEDLELRSRRMPKKPKQEKAPPTSPKLKIQQTELKKPEMISQLPQLDLPDDFRSDNKGAGAVAQKSVDREVIPIFRIQPSYPRQAALQNIEGFVVLEFDITTAGNTDNITVIQASPPQIFNTSAIQALRKWKYKPKIEDGKAVRQNGLKVQLDFNLRDE